MSRSARSGALTAIVAAAALTACSRPSMDPQVGPHLLGDAVAPIHIDFRCDNGINQISLTDDLGNPAWTFKARKTESVSWVVPQAVTINAISSKFSAIPLPLTTNGPQGKGNPYRGQVNADAQSRHYFYSIDVTCTPTSGDPVRLVIDPDMIIL